MMRIRIIPLTIIMAVLFMAVKLVDIARGTEALSEVFFISSVVAEQADGAAPDTVDPKPNGGEPKEKGEAALEEENPNVSTTAGKTSERSLSKVELELLQNLSRRREELDRWESNIQVKEAALDATEKRINDKITQIEAMKREVSNLLEQYNQQEDTKLKSLVRIYENMKPKDAARIFDELEMPILLLVVDKMAEKKAAPILSGMDPRKAKEVTVKLAAERRINNKKFNTLTSEEN